MTAPTIHHHQSVVRCQTAQVSRPHECCSITDGLIVDVKGRHDITQQVAGIDTALVHKVVTGHNIHRGC